jgi:hypothetical protein
MRRVLPPPSRPRKTASVVRSGEAGEGEGDEGEGPPSTDEEEGSGAIWFRPTPDAGRPKQLVI